MKHRWTRPVWQEGRVHFAEDGNGDPAFWRMEEHTDENRQQVPVWCNISAEYDNREEMGR
jgi:hypothetical protein